MAPNEQPAHGPAGKTAGDLLDSILTSPKRWLSLFIFLTACAGLAMLVMLVITRIFGMQAREIRIGASDSHIVFQAVDSRTGTEDSVVIVNPQGWQKTAIDLSAGDRLTFSANGKICLDMNEIWKKVQLRQVYEDAAAAKYNIKRDDPNEKRVPEDFFTDEQRKSLVLDRPWVDPGGFDLARFLPSFRSRRERYLLPERNAGGLVAAITKESDSTPARSDAFFVGRSLEDYAVTQKGWLWFTVNDVQYNDPNNPNLFYNDNLGSFWVRVTKKHK